MFDPGLVGELRAERLAALSVLGQCRNEAGHAAVVAADLAAAKGVFQSVGQAVQEATHTRLSSVITRCLQAVFPDDGYEFRVHFEKARGKTEARLVFLKRRRETDPISEDSGGVLDVAAFALRLACLVMARPPARRLLVLDEPMRYVSAKNMPAVRSLLESVCREMCLQILLVTHIDGLRCGKVVELGGF